ncbi:MAG TPA: cytochrome C [Planctomycetota bacterium]|nr:cytochrome C [Planctomycetota bacterium]
MRTALFATTLALAACTGAPSAAPEKVTYKNTIAALVQKRCGECHGPKSPTMAEFDKDKKAFKDKDLGPRYDTYENLLVVVNGADLGALMRRLDDGKNTKDGKPGNMNENLGDTPAERAANLELFKRWVGGWTLKRNAEVSAAERSAILAPRE